MTASERKRAYDRMYYANHREHYIEANSAYYAAHKLEKQQYNREYYIKNLERRREYFREYYKANAAKIKQRRIRKERNDAALQSEP